MNKLVTIVEQVGGWNHGKLLGAFDSFEQAQKFVYDFESSPDGCNCYIKGEIPLNPKVLKE
jgi:hypothetical protein